VLVSWGRAFRGALAFAVYSVIWMIVGAAIIIGGILAGGIGYGPYGIGMIIIVGIIGYLIMALGATAALFKISAEITAEEVEKRVKPATPQS